VPAEQVVPHFVEVEGGALHVLTTQLIPRLPQQVDAVGRDVAVFLPQLIVDVTDAEQALRSGPELVVEVLVDDGSVEQPLHRATWLAPVVEVYVVLGGTTNL